MPVVQTTEIYLFTTHDNLTCYNHDTATSAACNLNGAGVGGGPLRMDLVDSGLFLERQPIGRVWVR